MLLVAIFLRLYSLDTVPAVFQMTKLVDALRVLDGELLIFFRNNVARLSSSISRPSVAFLGQTDLASQP